MAGGGGGRRTVPCLKRRMAEAQFRLMVTTPGAAAEDIRAAINAIASARLPTGGDAEVECACKAIAHLAE